jgi:hypothetical protein
MTDPTAAAAWSAAVILSNDLGPDLPIKVEAAVAARGNQRHGQYAFDPVSVAILIVAIATLAWTIYNALHEPATVRDHRQTAPHHPSRPGDGAASQRGTNH